MCLVLGRLQTGEPTFEYLKECSVQTGWWLPDCLSAGSINHLEEKNNFMFENRAELGRAGQADSLFVSSKKVVKLYEVRPRQPGGRPQSNYKAGGEGGGRA